MQAFRELGLVKNFSFSLVSESQCKIQDWLMDTQLGQKGAA